MSFSVGIVGLPNVGKSTLFKALTKKQVEAANYPFCTIDPNVGVVAVPDERLAKLAQTEKSAKIVPTAIEFVDIAGLVKGAHKGEGLGNKFLNNIREVDAIVQVLRSFVDPDVTHVHGKIDPLADLETINLELIMADLEMVVKRLATVTREAKSGDKEALVLKNVLEKLNAHLEAEKLVIEMERTEDEDIIISRLNLLTDKPFLYVLNVSEGEKNIPAVFQHLNPVAISAKIESELAELEGEELKEYLKELDLDSTGLDRLIVAAYQALNLITFFTAGPKETRAWTVTKGSTAPQAAGKIHGDFEKYFIRADVVFWQVLVETGSWAKAKEQGQAHEEGKDYVTQDGDVMIIKHGA